MVSEVETAARFNDRVANYVAYRPGYPAEVIEFLRDELGLAPGALVADVGSGTGILSGLLLEAGCRVAGVEPNDAMRAAAESRLKSFAEFRSVKGTAEATTLEPASVDFVAAAQAFHWFDAEGARAEFRRILKPGGWVVLVWNMRRTDSTPFLRDYEKLLREFGTDYAQVNCEQASEDQIAEFFAGGFGSASFDNFQSFDFSGLRGRLLSSSYVPLAGHPKFEPMLAALRQLFDAHQRQDRVRVEYDAKVYYGRLA
ncbi:MAG: class I SAM-dependent methyltransferase [Acidobacteria bacterium]|nr:class I SAM-dependent methyltransferase [Acidobacteriota bacterium]MCA1640434.1 class I SAM-dependent methyltransferase [Acidobacteriota bacterium]